MNNLLRRLLYCAVILVSFAPSPITGLPGRQSTLPSAELGDPQELETFVDNIHNRQMADLHIAGAVVVIVKDGEVLLSKGYSYRDVEKKIPVDPETTLFRPGSVQKLITWTTVMQLVEQGKIDLNADVNTYLTDFKIPDTYPLPVTMLDLMSHTAGFAETTVGDSTYDPAEFTSLGVYLENHLPARIYPPGKVVLYSNYGASLAGYIVEQVSGKPHEQYLADHIFKPLGMEHSTAYQPVPDILAGHLSHSYTFDGSYHELPFLLLEINPAGGMSASGADLGRFMLAHLQDGEYNEARILQPETARQMHTQSFAFDPAMTGYSHGFAEWKVNGRKLIGHGGHIPEFISEMRLLLDEKVGIYVSYNTLIATDARTALIDAFMDHYYPARALEGEFTPAGNPPSANLSHYTGYYVPTRAISADTPEKFLALFSMTRVRAGPDNTLLYPGALLQSLNPFPLESWIETRPGVFQSASTGNILAFKDNEKGQVRYMAMDNVPYWSFVKQPWYGRFDFNLTILFFNLLIFVLTILITIIQWITARIQHRPHALQPWQAQLTRNLGFALSLTFVIFIVNVIILHPFDPGHISNRILAWIFVALSLPVTVLTAAAWQQGWWRQAGRLHCTVIDLAGLSFTGFMTYWNLLTPTW